MHFASDNTSGVAPEILAAVSEASTGNAAAYGDDAWTTSLDERFGEVFEHEVRVFPVVSGTAANSLALSVLAPSWGLVLCHETAHVYVDEAGAPEFLGEGARLHPLPGRAGKIDIGALSTAVARGGHGVHSSPASALTITQATEAGTVHTLDEIAERAALAHEHDVAVHMDGARFANAVASLGCSPADVTWRSGVDVLSFGATKNGAMDVDAVVFFDVDRVGEFERHRKRAGHLVSKMRFLSVQLHAYLADDLWLRLAADANAMARRLSEGLTATAGVQVLVPTDANELFVSVPPATVDRLVGAGAQFYEERLGDITAVRLVTSWSTTEADVDAFISVAGGLRTMAAVIEHLPEIGVTIISHWIFNAYVIHDGGDGRPFVVDVGVPRTAGDVARQLEAHGQRPEEIAAVVATHAHADHIAGVPHLHESAAARLLLPEKDRDYAAGETPRSPGPRAVAQIIPVMGDQPFDLGALVEMGQAAGTIGLDARGWKMPIEPQGFLADGATLPGAPDWQIMATPGHTDDSTSLYCERTRTLLSGDAVLAVGRRAWCNPEYVDADLSEQTELRLRALDVEVLLPGHGRAVAGPRVMQEALSFRERPPGERPGLMRYLRSHRD